MSGIIFLRSNKITDVTNAGLYELLKAHLFQLENEKSVFDEINVVVPTQAFAIWLQDKIATDYSVCANIDFIVLLGPVLNKIYLANNPGHIIYDLEDATYLIYKYLCQHRLNTRDADEVNRYLYHNDKLDKKRAYFLATQLHKIFHEYLYIRTNEILNLENSDIPLYQKELLTYLFKHQGETKNFLDIYKYFMQLNDNDCKLDLPKNIFIFGLNSVFSSQLQIIKKLANYTTVYWYYKTGSFDYYGDLLSDSAKNRLNKKFFKSPDLDIDDLYLNEGNPLMSNLGQQSREFIELLNQNDINVYDFKSYNSHHITKTMLKILQDDIATLSYRIQKRKRLLENNDYYKDPIALGDNDNSIKINVCHNKMREVQVMFNEVAALINSGVDIQNILITAPDIDDYAIYINAVFNNEFLADNNGNSYQLKCNVTGNRRYADHAILEVFSLIINMPYLCHVNYFLEILNSHVIQQSLKIDSEDVELVRKWLSDNHIYFGFDAKDYSQFGYSNYQVHSFKQFLINLTIGACIGDNNSELDYSENIQTFNDSIFAYDNIDSQQIPLCNKLIQLINLLEYVRANFYIDADNYRDLTVEDLHLVLSQIEKYLITNQTDVLKSQRFLGYINGAVKILDDRSSINLPIFNMIYEEYNNESNKSIHLNGYLTALSMQYARNIPYDYVYILGLNFDSFPRTYEPNILSVLSKSWYLADRNYTNEDKQTFLDILLSTNIKIYFSYIGRSEKDNSSIEPSSVLTELINVINDSFIDCNNIIEYHALHPFYKNLSNNYSKFWVDISTQISQNKELPVDSFKLRDYLTYEMFIDRFGQVCLENIINTFIYTNINLYRALNINTFDYDADLIEIENFDVHNRNTARDLFQIFEKYFIYKSVEQIYEYAYKKGVLAYGNLGQAQFNKYYDFYLIYVKKRGIKTNVEIKVKIEQIAFDIEDTIYLENNNIIITDKFENITQREPNEKNIPYNLKVKSLVIKAIFSKIPEYKNYPVILRDMNIEGLYSNYKIELLNENILDNIYKYYVDSYKRPILIHKTAISKFAETERNPHMVAENIYNSSFNNYELERLKTDFIYAQIADNYFEYTAMYNLTNDIIAIGNILSNITFSKV